MKFLVTGAAGTIGRAFVRHILAQKHEVVALDSNEWAVAEFATEFPKAVIRLEDFGDYTFADAPDVLIHCAAYKHVHLGESNPDAFIENNITKTALLFKRAKEMATKIVFISTDKAVEPISTYGATKYLGEKLAWFYGGKVARLGNVIASNGSVIPVWEQAIREGKPIKVTDERMTRYMIEVDDAIKQIWEGMKGNAMLIVPDMGEPIKITDLINQVLQKHDYGGLNEYGPGTEVIGIRPGEKLHEVLRWESEYEGTGHGR